MKLNLPKDADGNVILSNVKVMYKKDGSVVRVDNMIYFAFSKKWRVSSGPLMFIPSQLYLNKPDSLEQLAADLDRVANHPDMGVCAYLDRDDTDCDGCKFSDSELDCFGRKKCIKSFTLDVIARVHRLAGDAE